MAVQALEAASASPAGFLRWRGNTIQVSRGNAFISGLFRGLLARLASAATALSGGTIIRVLGMRREEATEDVTSRQFQSFRQSWALSSKCGLSRPFAQLRGACRVDVLRLHSRVFATFAASTFRLAFGLSSLAFQKKTDQACSSWFTTSRAAWD